MYKFFVKNVYGAVAKWYSKGLQNPYTRVRFPPAPPSEGIPQLLAVCRELKRATICRQQMASRAAVCELAE